MYIHTASLACCLECSFPHLLRAIMLLRPFRESVYPMQGAQMLNVTAVGKPYIYHCNKMGASQRGRIGARS